MNRILKSQKRLKKCKTNRFAAWLLAVLMLFSALPTGSITVHAETETTGVAQIGETTYTSLEDAIKEADSGNTIRLIDDTEKTEIILRNDITLDLGGYTLEADYFMAYDGTNVIDSSNDKTGILKVPDEQFKLSSSNSQMPVYDATKGGYAFAEIVHQEHVIDNAEADTYEFIFKPYFGATINKLLEDGGDTAEVDFGIRLKWGTIEKDIPDLLYEDDIVKQVYKEGSGLAFRVKLTGVNKFEGLTITPFIKSERGTVCLGTEYPATLVTGDDTGAWTEGDTTYASREKGYYFKNAGDEGGFAFSRGTTHYAARDLLSVTGGGTDAVAIWDTQTLNIAAADADAIRIRINTEVASTVMRLVVTYTTKSDNSKKYFIKDNPYTTDEDGWAVVTVDLSKSEYHTEDYVIKELGLYPLGVDTKTGTAYIDYIEVLKKAEEPVLVTGDDTGAWAAGDTTYASREKGYYFKNAGDEEGFGFGGDATHYAARDLLSVTGGGTQVASIWSPKKLNIATADADTIRIRINTEVESPQMQLNVGYAKSGDSATSKWFTKDISYNTDEDGWAVVTVDLSEAKAFDDGTVLHTNEYVINELGLYPLGVDTDAAKTGTVYIDYIEVLKKAVLFGYYFTANSESWVFGYDETIGPPWVQSGDNVWENGALRRSATLAGGKFWSPTLKVDAAKADYVLLRVKVDGATEGSTVKVAVQVESEWKYYSKQLTEDIRATDGYYEVKLDLPEVNSGTISSIGITQWYDETTGAETTQTFYMDSCEIWGTADSE